MGDSSERAVVLARLAQLRREAAELEQRLGMQGGVGKLPAPGPLDSVSVYELVARLGSDFLSIHAANGDYLFASPNVTRLFGWAPDELLGTSAYALFHEADLERIAKDHAGHPEGQPGSVRYRLRCKDGEHRWVETRSSAHVDHDGVHQIICITRDIEAQVRYEALVHDQREAAEREVAALSDQLVRAERLATLGTVAAGVGHELNNVATALVPALAMLEEQLGQGLLPNADDLDLLQWASSHVQMHARHLLDLGRPSGSEATEVLDLRDLAADTVRMLGAIGRIRGVEVVTDLSEAPVRVRGRRARIEQVLVNLVANAADAMDGRDERRLTVAVRPDRRRAWCEVRDTGEGIAPDRMPSIFEPYFTTKPAGQGTGLGLCVVRRLVNEHGGHVDVKSEPGRGTTVRFWLDLAQP